MTDAAADLRHAILATHGVYATHIGRSPVKLMVPGEMAREVAVEVFDIVGHATATLCYAWCGSATPASAQAKIFCVLRVPPVVSPESAVRSVMEAPTRGA